MKTIRNILILCVLTLVPYVASAIVVTANVSGSQKTYSEDVVVASGVEIYPSRLYINRTINIENNGVIKSNVFVVGNRDLYIKNRGVIDSNFILGENAKLYQVISDESDINKVGFDKSYTAIINSERALNLSELMNVVGDAEKFVFNNSVINFDVMRDINDVELVGNNVLILNDLSNVYERAILRDVSGSGTVQIVTNNPDVLFADVVYINDNDLFLKRVRETDYVKILKNDVGVFLNKLRNDNPKDGLLYKLDRALSMDGLTRVMKSSARLNSDVLMRPMQIINMLDVSKFMGGDTGVYAEPMMVLSSDFMASAVTAGVGIVNKGKYGIAINLRSGEMEYESDIDAFTGDFVGGSLDLHCWFDDVFVRAVGGMDFSRYDIGDVLYENNLLHNPDARSIFAEFDIGYNLDVTDSIYVMPIVGVMGWEYTIDKMSKLDTSAHVGVGAGYVFDMLGIKYDYGLYTKLNSDNASVVTLRAGFWSEFDAAGGDVTLSIAHMFDVLSYKLSIGGRVWF